VQIVIADTGPVEAGAHAGETVQIPGWLYNLRRSGKIAFPILRDGYGTLQCVAVKAHLPEDLLETIKNLTHINDNNREDDRRPFPERGRHCRLEEGHGVVAQPGGPISVAAGIEGAAGPSIYWRTEAP
jgi:hypothetical protein